MNTLAEKPRNDSRIVAPRLQLPVIRGVIDRRLLINFRCDPDALTPLVPAPFRMKLVHGFGMAGICLIRLKNVGPRWLPSPFGVASENAAHRIAVEWDEVGQRREGVFIPRRDTSSRLNEFAGGRLFPGVHHHADLKVWESPDSFKVELNSDDGQMHARVAVRVVEALPNNSAFASLDEASRFFCAGSLGWSARPELGKFDGLELHTLGWKMEPLLIERVESSFFGNQNLFPKGTAEFDSAFLMRGIEHEWHARGRMICTYDA